MEDNTSLILFIKIVITIAFVSIIVFLIGELKKAKDTTNSKKDYEIYEFYHSIVSALGFVFPVIMFLGKSLNNIWMPMFLIFPLSVAGLKLKNKRKGIADYSPKTRYCLLGYLLLVTAMYWGVNY